VLTATFRSLRHPRFRAFFVGQTVSVVGFWLQQIALSWLVYRLTKSPLMLGVVAFAGTIPMLVLSPIAGVIVDRVDRRRVVLATQTAQMLQAFALAAFTFAGAIRPEWIPWLAAVYGVAWAFDAPARQALLPLMVGGREDMPNAIALNSLIMNLGRFVGPVIAGALLALAGEAWCFLLNGLSFLAVLRALHALPSAPPARAPGAWRAQLADGFSWVWRFAPARLLIAHLVLMSLTLPGYQSLMPIFAAEVFGGDARVQGLLVTCAGAGALASTAMLAARPSVRGLVRVILGATFAAGVALVAFSWTTWLPAACLALAVVGGGIILCAAGTNTVLQSVVDDDRRGRVVSIYVMAFLGIMPLGNLATGWLARHAGAAAALTIAGGVCAAGSLAFLFAYPRIRAGLLPVYRELGIIPAGEETKG
jgi:MFS family permease